MRLLIINSVCGIKSTGKIAFQIASDYISKGYDVKIAYGREETIKEAHDISYRIGNKNSPLLNYASCIFFDNDGFAAKNNTKRFLKWADEFNPDELWLHNLHGYYINVEMLFVWIKSRPQMKVQWTLHDCWAFTGHCSYFSFNKCDKWKTHCEKCAYHREYPSSFVDNSKRNYEKKKNLFTGVRDLTIITPSKWLANLVKKSFLSEYPVEVINNKIDLNIFKPSPSNFREFYGLVGKKIILGVALPWSKRKGFDDFVELSKFIDETYKIVLVGLSKKQIKKCPPNVLGLEKTTNAIELAQIYTAADVFLNLTYEDNYPTTNLEAQACGTPCITYNTGGSIESVSSNCVVSTGNISQLVSKIKSIL